MKKSTLIFMELIYSVPVSATAACYSIKINNRSSYVTTYLRGEVLFSFEVCAHIFN